MRNVYLNLKVIESCRFAKFQFVFICHLSFISVTTKNHQMCVFAKHRKIIVKNDWIIFNIRLQNFETCDIRKFSKRRLTLVRLSAIPEDKT
jgi:hypothetical protein